MASIRKLKDEINQASFELINRCITQRNFQPDKENKINGIIKDLVRVRGELIKRSNNPENTNDPKKLREYYSKIREDLGRLEKLVHGIAG